MYCDFAWGGYTILPEPYDYYFEKIILRTAVPFFFVCSGYFLKKNIGQGKSIFSYCIRLMKPLVVFETINIILEILKQLLRGTDTISIVKSVVKHVLFYPYGALWYLQASIVGALLLYPFVIKKKLTAAYVAGIFLYGFALICNNYYFVVFQHPALKKLVDLYMDTFISARNGVFVGFFFLLLGMRINETNQGLKQKSMLFLTGFLLILETVFLYDRSGTDDRALFIAHIAFVPSLVSFILNIRVNMSDKVSLQLRSLSTGLYLQHRIWLSVIELIGLTLGLYFGRLSSCIVVIAVSCAVCFWTEKKRCEPLYSLLR